MSNPEKKRRVRPVLPDQPPPPPAQERPRQDASPPPQQEPPRPAPPPPPPPRREEPRAAEPVAQIEIVEPGVVDEENDKDKPVERPSWTLDASGKDLNSKLLSLKDDIGYWVQKGRFNKVRVSKDGKKVLPDIPVGALLAAEVATLAWAGALRTAIVNVAGRLLFKVELINDAQEHLTAAKEHYAKGDLDEAEAEAVRCVKVDGRLPEAFLLLGTLAKVRGNRDEALRHFRKARDLDPHGDIGRQAEAAGRRLDPDFAAPANTPEKT